MDGCEYSIETIIAPLKERISRTNVLYEINMLKKLLKQWMTANFPVKISTVHLKE